MIFDFHARLAPRRRAGETLLAAMDRAGIDRAAVSAGGLLDLDRLAGQILHGGRSDVAADNEWVRRECAGSGGRLLPFFFADPYRDLDVYRMTAGRYRGLELSPAVHGFRFDDPRVHAFAGVAATAGHPVYVVCLGRPGAQTEDLVTLAKCHPDVTFVFGHCGHIGLDAAGLTWIAPVRNIVAETSGCFTAIARLAVQRLGADRVLFGTEYPLQDAAVELAKLIALGLEPPDLFQVAAGNACRLLGEEPTWTP